MINYYILEFKKKGSRGYWNTTLCANNEEEAIQQAKEFIKNKPDIERYKITKLVTTKRIIYDSGKEIR